MINYLKHSGLWAGLILNPYHWQFKWDQSYNDDPIFENAVYFGPFWIRLIVDKGDW